MRAAEGGGSSSTIVVDITGVRQASAVFADVSQAFSVLGSRLRGRALPDMPPGVGAWVSGEIAEVAGALRSLPQPMLDIAQELRVRGFWAEIADKLLAGQDLTGAELTEFKAAYASGLLAKYADPGEADRAKVYARKVHDREHPGGFTGFLHDAGDFFSGAWDSIKDPAVSLYHLTPLSSGWTHSWSELGQGLEYGVTHPVEFGKEMINLQALHDRGFGYWLGNIAPAALATVFSGGAAAGLRGAEATDRIVAGAAAADRLVDGEEVLAASGRLKAAFGADHAWTHDVLHPGPLTPSGMSVEEMRLSAAQTFAGGKYDMVSEPEKYMVFKAGEHPGGRFFTLEPPASEAQVRIDSAVKPHWMTPEGAYSGSSPLPSGYAYVVEHPEHPLPMGPAGEQGGVYLGGPDKIQVYIDDRGAAGLRQVGEWSLHDPPDWVRQLTEQR
jgi:hypothetical protein